MSWATIDFQNDPNLARSTDCYKPPLLAYVADRAEPSFRGGGWKILHANEAAQAVDIKRVSVVNELAQMAKRGTVEIDNLGDGDYRVRLTPAGQAIIDAGAVSAHRN